MAACHGINNTKGNTAEGYIWRKKMAINRKDK